MREDKIKSRYQLYLFADTQRAVLVDKEPKGHKLHQGFWLPKSQIDVVERKRDGWDEVVVLDIPLWLAERNNLDATLDGEVVE